VCRSLNPNNDIAIKSGLRVMPTGDVTQTGQTAKMPITATVDGKTQLRVHRLQTGIRSLVLHRPRTELTLTQSAP
jgi:hypothetical protein